MRLAFGLVVDGDLLGDVLGDFFHELLAEKIVGHELAKVRHVAAVVGRHSVLVLSIVFDVLGDGVADLRLAPRALLTVDDWAIFVSLCRLAVLGNHLQVLNLQVAQILLQL